jgi:hypothetical protein
MLLDSLIFQKTDTARAELSGRTLGLSNELRLVLVLIDGRRDVAALAALSPRVATSRDCLEQLLDMAAIEVIGESQPGEGTQFGFDAARGADAVRSPEVMRRDVTIASVTMPSPVANMQSMAVNVAPAAIDRTVTEKTNSRVLQARAQLSGEITRLLGADGQLAAERVRLMGSRDELLEALPKLVNLVALYGHANDAQRIRTDITYLLAMA